MEISTTLSTDKNGNKNKKELQKSLQLQLYLIKTLVALVAQHTRIYCKYLVSSFRLTASSIVGQFNNFSMCALFDLIAHTPMRAYVLRVI